MKYTSVAAWVRLVMLALGVILCPATALGQSQTLTLQCVRDNTLYEDILGASSNGVGANLFVGKTNSNLIRRGLVRFNLGIIPAGATVTSATLTMYMSRTINGSQAVTVHRTLADWGEGTSNAGGNEGNGAGATPGDATWVNRFFGTTNFWNTAGGDFVAGASSTTSVSGTGSYSWTGAGLVADVQAWVDDPSSNFGWLIKGNEATFPTAKRFDSRENSNGSRRPVLSVTYTPPAGPVGACCLPSGDCVVTSSGACASQGGTYSGDGSSCTPSPCPPPPTGACCQSGGVCSTLSAAQCANIGGVYQGDGTPCSPLPCPLVLVPFVDALPIPPVAQPTSGTPGGAATYTLAVRQALQRLHRDLPLTTIWGYNGSFPGPTIEARRDQPVTVTWVNDLRDALGQLLTTHYLPVDQCLHGPDMTGSVPLTVTHLHGAKVAPQFDGYPEDAFPPGAQSPAYTYPNGQRATTLWYHDHALGLTRLNVYMGLAGAYIIREASEGILNLPSGRYDVPLILTDRSFNADGSLKYPEEWHEHFFGDFILVNGKVWPFFLVDQGRYRFRLVNASGSRFYTLALSNGASFQQISSDQGLLAAPVTMSSITISPGERAEIVVNFAGLGAGQEVTLVNSAAAPFPDGDPMHEVPNVMKFIGTGAAGFAAAPSPTLSTITPIPESQSVRSRDFALRLRPAEHMDKECMMAGHLMELWAINDLLWDDITERPRLGTVEIWNWVNRSGTSHPMHIHLVQVQVLDRQAFVAMGEAIMPVGPRIPPPPGEAGWKDTVQAPPGMITRVITRFEGFTGVYPYHCHILEHEDNEMMRQFVIRPTCLGDANDDGVVNFTDVTAVLSNFAASGAPFMFGDATGNGVVNFADVTSVLSAFGTVCN